MPIDDTSFPLDNVSLLKPDLQFEKPAKPGRPGSRFKNIQTKIQDLANDIVKPENQRAKYIAIAGGVVTVAAAALASAWMLGAFSSAQQQPPKELFPPLLTIAENNSTKGFLVKNGGFCCYPVAPQVTRKLDNKQEPQQAKAPTLLRE